MPHPPFLDRIQFTARPDTIDFRDRMFVPTLVEVPASRSVARYLMTFGGKAPILDQGMEGACTGYALATVAHYLLASRDRRPSVTAPPGLTSPTGAVSPQMMYQMAQRHDEWEGEDYDGASARGAMKAWHKHGVCAAELWPPRGPTDENVAAGGPIWQDAQQRPLGAYFRVNHKDLVAMHGAISEVGVLYATGTVHDGWAADSVEEGDIEPGGAVMGGHAFAIVGYDRVGFHIQNSWGERWGVGGFARLHYRDWLDLGSDVWVARLGVPMELTAKAAGIGLANRLAGGSSRLHFEVAPHVIALGNEGLPRPTGSAGTSKEDIQRLVSVSLREWVDSRDDDETAHIVLYAHGGLVTEPAALQRLADFTEPFMAHGIYPVSFIWKTDYWTTLSNMLRDVLARRRSEGFLDAAKDFMLERLDRTIEPLARRVSGKAEWDTMKESALAASRSSAGGARIFVRALQSTLGDEIRAGKVQIHMMAHSAGSILLGPIAQLLCAEDPVQLVDLQGQPRGRAVAGANLPVTSVNLWAPACTIDFFRGAYQPSIEARRIERFGLFTLDEEGELDDHVARIYNKSLLYLVSNAFEDPPEGIRRQDGEPILGMAKFVASELSDLFDGDRTMWVQSKNEWSWSSGRRSESASHSGFDDDPATVVSSLLRVLDREGDEALTASLRSKVTFERSASSQGDRRRGLPE